METRSGFVETNGGKLFYEVAGAGQPLLMLHAGIAHSAMWDPQFNYFAPNYRVIRFDQRGFGKTITTSNEFSRRADVLAILDKLGVARAVVMGCSMGGGLALDFTLEQPERVAALILIAAGISGNQAPPELVKQWDEQDAALEAGDIERVIELELQMWVDGPNRTPAESDPATRAQVRAMELDNLKIKTDGYKPLPLDPPALGRLHEVKVPTLVIIGDGDQPYTVAQAYQLAQGIRNAQLMEIQNVGHLPSMERAQDVNARIEGFLAEIED